MTSLPRLLTALLLLSACGSDSDSKEGDSKEGDSKEGESETGETAGFQQDTGGSSGGDGDTDGTDSGDSGDTDSAWVLPEEAVSTLAGTGEYLSRDGSWADAAFSEPVALAFAPDESLVVAEARGDLRLVSPDGTVTTLAVDMDIPRPTGLAYGPDGALYVADGDLNCILRIVDGSATPFAGSCGTAGFADGLDGLFDLPRGLSMSASGELLVADCENMRLRSVSPDGSISTLAGHGEITPPSEGEARSASIYFPFAIAADASGAVWFSGMDHCIRRVVDGMVENVAGLCSNYGNTGTDDGAAADARFDSPWGLAIDADGGVAIADSFNDRLRHLSADGSTVRTVAGSITGHLDGSAEEALFNVPRAIAIHPDGWWAVADSVNHRIRFVRP